MKIGQQTLTVMMTMMKMMSMLNIARNVHFTSSQDYKKQPCPTWKLTENQGLLKLARQYMDRGEAVTVMQMLLKMM